MILKSRTPLGDYPRCLSVYLEQWAKQTPDRPFLMERGANGAWQGVTYAQARDRVRRVATSLLQRGVSATRPAMILSDNSVEHAILMVAAPHVGVPSVSVSAAYSTMSTDFEKLRNIVSCVEPGIIYCSSMLEATKYFSTTRLKLTERCARPAASRTLRSGRRCCTSGTFRQALCLNPTTRCREPASFSSDTSRISLRAPSTNT